MNRFFIVITMAVAPMCMVSADSFSYMQDFLGDTEICKRCMQENARWFQYGPFKSSVLRECEFVEKILADHDQNIKKRSQAGYLGDWIEVLVGLAYSEALKSSMRIILADQADAVKWKEYDMVVNAASAVQRRYKDRIEQEKKEQETRRQAAQANPKF